MELYKYGQAEIKYLKYRDEKLGKAIESIGKIEREITPDLFEALVKIIISQQISSKAAATIWTRLCEKLWEITPNSIANAGKFHIQKCGLSMRKAGYIKGIADKVISGDLDLSEIRKMPDVEIIKKLSSFEGIGTWTSEMFLIFSLSRPDVFSWGDLAIRRGIMNLYGLSALTKEQFEQYRIRYSPYGSTASLYLWELSVQSHS